MNRQPFKTRIIRIVGEQQKQTAIAALNAAPVDSVKPLEMVLREEVKARKPDQNSLMWAGPLKDIEEQAYVNGRTYKDTVWHEHFKAEYLPEEFDPELCKNASYKKWDYNPKGERALVGSTTDLTVKGFALYLEQVIAFGAGLGVQFRANPRDRMVA